jgi:hypothetical protein
VDALVGNQLLVVLDYPSELAEGFETNLPLFRLELLQKYLKFFFAVIEWHQAFTTGVLCLGFHSYDLLTEGFDDTVAFLTDAVIIFGASKDCFIVCSTRRV